MHVDIMTEQSTRMLENEPAMIAERLGFELGLDTCAVPLVAMGIGDVTLLVADSIVAELVIEASRGAKLFKEGEEDGNVSLVCIDEAATVPLPMTRDWKDNAGMK